MTTEKWLQKNGVSLEGKTVAITGSTGGLGGALAPLLLRFGARLLLLDRSVQRSDGHRAKLLRAFPDAKIRCIPLDLEKPESVARATEELLLDLPDIFVHNAGAYSIPRHLCESGYENVFQINFASPYYMIRTLLPAISQKQGHVMIVGSIAHRYSRTDPDDVDFRTRRAASRVYGNAKRYLMFSLYELFREEERATLAVTHPGITLTNITAHYPKPLYALIKYPMKLIFMSPRRAALSLLAGVFSPTAYGEWIGPALFDVWGLPKKRMLHSLRPGEREEIARTAEEVYANCEKTCKP